MKYILTIAEERSFSKAAQKLYIAQPSLSQYVIKLEQQLGVELFDRTTTPIRLTYDGELYAETARHILDLNTQLLQQMEDSSNLKKGRLILGLPPSRSTYILPVILPVFHQKFPGIEIVLVEGSSSELEEYAIKRDTDITIIPLPVKENLFSYVPILTEEILIAIPPNHSLSIVEKELCHKQKRPCIGLEQLREEPFILTKQNQKLRQIADDLFLQAGFKPRIILETKSIEAAHAMVAAGVGITFIPDTVIWFGQITQSPSYFSIESLAPTRTVAVAYLKGRYLSRAAFEFIEVAKEIKNSLGYKY